MIITPIFVAIIIIVIVILVELSLTTVLIMAFGTWFQTHQEGPQVPDPPGRAAGGIFGLLPSPRIPLLNDPACVEYGCEALRGVTQPQTSLTQRTVLPENLPTNVVLQF